MKDFFISYNSNDTNWAEWIAWQLEERGYTTVLQAWDFRPGSNFVLEMQNAASKSERTIAVLSQDYLSAYFTHPEWAVAFAQDPKGESSTLLPVRVRECNLKGLLFPIIDIDLVGKEEDTAREKLLNGIIRGRVKPKRPPIFPEANRTVSKQPIYPCHNPSYKKNELYDITGTEIIAPYSLPYTFTGREKKIVEINKALLKEKPIVILLKGPPGIGKTTLALKIIDYHKVLTTYRKIIFVDCSEHIKYNEILGEVGRGIFGEEYDSIQEKKREEKVFEKLNNDNLLLILDDFESVDKNEKNLIGKLLRKVEKSRIIITSREVVGVSGYENTVSIEPMESEESKELFIKHAKEVGYIVKEADTQIISKIVTELEGIPLAVILAARLLGGAYNMKRLLKDIKEKMTLILRDEDLADDKEKNKALNASIDLSYGRLCDEAKELFKRFSIFRSPVNIEVVDYVCELKDIKYLSELVKKSLILKEKEKNEEDKYRMLAYLRDYGQNKLSDEKNRLHQRAADYFASLPIPKKGEIKSRKEVSSLLEAHYHACKAENYSQAYELLYNNFFEESLLHIGESATLLQLCNDMMPNGISYLPKQKEGIILETIGETLHNLGQFEESITHYQKSLDIAREFKEEQRECKLLGNIGNIYRGLGKPNEAIENLEKGLQIAEKNKDKRNEAKLVGILGEAYRDTSRFDKAIDYLKRALDISREIKDRKEEGIILSDIGVVYHFMNQYEKAIEFYKNGLAILEELGDQWNIGVCLGSLEASYRALGELDKSRKYLERALKIARDINDERGQGRCLCNLGITYRKLKQFDDSIKSLKEGIEILRKINDLRGVNRYLSNIGTTYGEIGEFNEAIKCIREALTIAREIKNKRSESICTTNLGSVYYSKKDYEKAIDLYKESLDIARDIKDHKSEGMSLYNLGKVYIKQKEYKFALRYLLQSRKLFFEIKDAKLKEIEKSMTELKEILGEIEFQKMLDECEM